MYEVCVQGPPADDRRGHRLRPPRRVAGARWPSAAWYDGHVASPRQQAWRRRIGDERVNRTVHEVPQIAPLSQAALMNAEAARQEEVAAQRPCRPGDLALEHDAAQRLLSGIVGRCQTRIGCERPQRRPQLEDVGASVGCAAAFVLLRTVLQRRADSPLQSVELLTGQLVLVASAEHNQTQPEQFAPDLPGQALPLPDPIEVAQQMRPANLPALGVDERIASIPVRRDRCGALVADEVQDHIPRPRRVDGEHRQQRLHRHPDPVGDALARVAGLVHPQRIGAAQRCRRLGHWRLERLGELAVRLRDGAYAETQAHQLVQQIADLALREVVARAQHALPKASALGPSCPLGTPAGSTPACGFPQPAQRPL